MTRVLITAIAGDVAQSIALIINEFYPDWNLIGCDIHNRHGGSLYTKKCFLAPRADSNNYLIWLNDIIIKEKIDYCIPTSEAELFLLASKNIYQLTRTHFIMPSSRSITVGSDKLKTIRFLEEIGCPAPWTIAADNEKIIPQYPCVFKPRRGAGSNHFFICNDQSDAKFLSKKIPGGVFQELLLPDEEEVTCAVYRTKKGDLAILQLLRKLSDGSTSWGKVIKNQEVLEQCILVAEKLDLVGSINIQLRITEKGPRIFEINPRFSSTVRLRHLMGFSDLIWSIKEVLNEKFELFNPPEGIVGVRSPNVKIINKNNDFNQVDGSIISYCSDLN